MRTLRHSFVFTGLFLASLGCSNEYSPTAPRPNAPPSQDAHIAGNVYAEVENNCPENASVEVLDGPRAGLRVVQDFKTCVEEGNGWFSFWISDLPPATAVRLRASAPGYVSREATVFPSRLTLGSLTLGSLTLGSTIGF
ncbi:MAG TPA: hypothetical protein VMO47_06260 [Rhodothermales bacterium]|nr:hypothetical protein [Rhodothermales bacterium]